MHRKILLLLSFIITVHLAAAQESERWEKDIRQFESVDSIKMPSQGAILFTGSSSIRMWKTLHNDFPDIITINRGFGGSTIADADYFFDRIVSKYKPRAVVFYAGDNDIANGMSPEAVFADFVEFAQKMKRKLPKARLLYLSIKPSLARWDMYPKMEQVNKKIEKYAKGKKNIQYVDVSSPMLKNGKPDASLFLEDGLHMNEKGYEVWTQVLKPYLAKIAAK